MSLIRYRNPEGVDDVVLGEIPSIEHAPAAVDRNILAEAILITQGDRQKVYGKPKENFDRISKISSALIGRNITPYECVLVLMGVKFARLMNTPSHVDSKTDIAGYAWILDQVSE